MRRRAAIELVGVERFPVEVVDLSEEWATRALEALRVAAVSRNGMGAGREHGADSDRWLIRHRPRREW